MKLLVTLFLIYIIGIFLLFIFQCWTTLLVIFGLGVVTFIYAILTAEEVPDELNNLF